MPREPPHECTITDYGATHAWNSTEGFRPMLFVEETRANKFAHATLDEPTE